MSWKRASSVNFEAFRKLWDLGMPGASRSRSSWRTNRVARVSDAWAPSCVLRSASSGGTPWGIGWRRTQRLDWAGRRGERAPCRFRWGRIGLPPASWFPLVVRRCRQCLSIRLCLASTWRGPPRQSPLPSDRFAAPAADLTFGKSSVIGTWRLWLSSFARARVAVGALGSWRRSSVGTASLRAAARLCTKRL